MISERLCHLYKIAFLLSHPSPAQRFQWVFFRVENEQVNNIGMYRVVKDIPVLQENTGNTMVNYLQGFYRQLLSESESLSEYNKAKMEEVVMGRRKFGEDDDEEEGEGEEEEEEGEEEVEEEEEERGVPMSGYEMLHTTQRGGGVERERSDDIEMVVVE